MDTYSPNMLWIQGRYGKDKQKPCMIASYKNTNYDLGSVMVIDRGRSGIGVLRFDKDRNKGKEDINHIVLITNFRGRYAAFGVPEIPETAEDPEIRSLGQNLEILLDTSSEKIIASVKKKYRSTAAGHRLEQIVPTLGPFDMN